MDIIKTLKDNNSCCFTMFHVGLLRYFTIFLTISALPTNGQCPDNAYKMAQDCLVQMMTYFPHTRPVSGPQGHDKGLINSTTEFISHNSALRVERACLEGNLQSMVNCVQEIYQDCRLNTSESAVLLRSAIDFDNLRQGVDYLCNNVDTYVEHSACMGKQQSGVVACANKEFSNLKELTESTDNQNLVASMQCMFVAKAFHCGVTEVAGNCGPAAGDITETLLRLSWPPICKDFRYSIPEMNYSSRNLANRLIFSKLSNIVFVILAMFLYLFK